MNLLKRLFSLFISMIIVVTCIFLYKKKFIENTIYTLYQIDSVDKPKSHAQKCTFKSNRTGRNKKHSTTCYHMTSFSPPSKNMQMLRIFLTKRVGKLRDDAKKIRNRPVFRGLFRSSPTFSCARNFPFLMWGYLCNSEIARIKISLRTYHF